MADNSGPDGGRPYPPIPDFNGALNTLRGFGQGPTGPQLPPGFDPRAIPQGQGYAPPTGSLGGINDFVQGAIQPFTSDIAGKAADFRSLLGGPQSDYFNSPEARANAIAMQQWTRSGSGGLADIHVPGQAVAGVKAAGTAALEGAPQAAGDFAASMGQRVPQAVRAGSEVPKPASAAQKAGGAPDIITRQLDALRASGATDAQIADFAKQMGGTAVDAAQAAPRQGQIITATGADVSAGKMTRALQTALGTDAGGGMPTVLHDFTPGGAKFAGEGRRHGGVIGAATRAVMANDPVITDLLGPELTQQLAQGKIAQLARNSGVDDTIIRQALQIMDNAAKTVAPEAKSMVADSVATKTVLSAEAEQAVFAAEHKALTEAGLAATDEAMQAMRDRLIADARRGTQAAVQSTQDSTGLLNALRQQGMTDNQIFTELRGMGLSPADAVTTIRNYTDMRYPSAVESGVGPTIQHVRPGGGVTQPDSLFATSGRNSVEALGQPPTPPGPPLPPAPPIVPPQEPIAFRATKMFGSALGGFVDALKQGAASMDISQLGRQGLIPVVSAALSRDPQLRIVARDAFVNAVKGYGDKYAGRVWSEVMADPMYAKWRAAGGAERTIPANSLEHLQTGAVRSELFTGPLANVAPIRASDRSFSLTLNALNFYRWKDGIEGIRAGGRIATEAEQKALSNWYNVTTGQGNLPTGVASALNRVFWAPRFVVSRVQTPYYAVKYLADPATREVGKLAAKDLAKTTVAGIGFLEAAQLAGFKVGWDPTSTDFGKVQVGNTTLDIWGGFSQPAVFAARMLLDQYTSSSGVKSSLSQGGFAGTSVSDLIQRFEESKLGPGPGIVIAFASGKDFTGTPFGPRGGQTPEETLAALASGRAVPMSWADIVSAVHDDLQNGTSANRGLPPGLVGGIAGATSLLGVGASTYPRTKSYDGLGRDLNGPVPDEPVLDAWKAVRDNSPKSPGTVTNPKGTATFSDLTAPDATIGSGVNQILVTPEEQGQLAKTVGDARRAIIGAAIASPKYQAGGQGDKEKILSDAKTQADAYGTAQFGAELAKVATDDVSRTRAARIALSAGADTGRKMDTLSQLAAQGSLTPGTKAALDDLRTYKDPLGKGYELSVDDYLRGGQLVQQYLSHPAFTIGTEQTWIQAANESSLMRAAYTAMEREATNRGVKIWTLGGYKTYLDQRNTVKVDGFPIQRFVQLDGTINDVAVSPQRKALSQDPLWSHFRAVATKRDPYSPR